MLFISWFLRKKDECVFCRVSRWMVIDGLLVWCVVLLVTLLTEEMRFAHAFVSVAVVASGVVAALHTVPRLPHHRVVLAVVAGSVWALVGSAGSVILVAYGDFVLFSLHDIVGYTILAGAYPILAAGIAYAFEKQ